MGAVKNAMTRDGLDPDIMDLDHDKSVASQMKKGEDDDGPPLKEDEKYQKYFKMLNMVSYEDTCFSVTKLVTVRLMYRSSFAGSSNGCC